MGFLLLSLMEPLALNLKVTRFLAERKVCLGRDSLWAAHLSWLAPPMAEVPL